MMLKRKGIDKDEAIKESVLLKVPLVVSMKAQTACNSPTSILMCFIRQVSIFT